MALTLGGVSCASLPPIKAVRPAEGPLLEETCRRPFLQGPSRLVHAIEAALPDSSTLSALGVTLADPRNGSCRSILMTLEGLILLDAEWREGKVTVHHGVPPFRGEAFARNLLSDVRLLMFAPGGPPMAVGHGQDGRVVCRYGEADGTVVDVAAPPGGPWEIHTYRDGRPVQRGRFLDLNGEGIPTRVEIGASGPGGYGLTLRLIEYEAVSGDTGL